MASFPMEEVQKHKTKESLWIVINGKVQMPTDANFSISICAVLYFLVFLCDVSRFFQVLDVTKWLDKHPGGKSALLRVSFDVHRNFCFGVHGK